MEFISISTPDWWKFQKNRSLSVKNEITEVQTFVNFSIT